MMSYESVGRIRANAEIQSANIRAEATTAAAQIGADASPPNADTSADATQYASGLYDDDSSIFTGHLP
jgi:hypothetical protein